MYPANESEEHARIVGLLGRELILPGTRAQLRWSRSCFPRFEQLLRINIVAHWVPGELRRVTQMLARSPAIAVVIHIQLNTVMVGIFVVEGSLGSSIRAQ